MIIPAKRVINGDT